jgi:branched-chain amino acid transport system permease protein
VIIGGIGSVEGPIIGTLVFFALRFFLADYGALYLITLGTIAIAVMLTAPRGLWGLIGDGLNIHLFPVQRRVRIDFSDTVILSTTGENAAFRPNETPPSSHN